MTREEILSAIAKTDKVINNPTMPEAVKQVAIDTRAKYQAQLDAMGGEEPKVEKEEVVETEVEKEVEKEVVAPKKERVKFERKPRTPKAPTPKKEEETPESKAEKSMEGKKLTVANCRELLAKLKTRREGAKKRVATRKKQGKPAELTTIEVLKKASDNLEKKVETEVNKDGKLQKTTITRSTKEVVDIVATIISGIPTKAERTEYINEVIADLKKLIDKVEPITEKMARGGEIGQELMGGQPNQKKPSGAILLEVRKNGKEIVVTEDDGKTKELYVKSNGFSGYTLHYKGNEYEFANSLDSYAKGGNVYSSDKLYILKVYDGETGKLLDMSKRIWASNIKRAKEEANLYEDDMKEEYGDYLRFSIEEAPSMFAKGGKITRNKNKNDYKSMFEFFVENNYQPIGKRDLINMAYESSNGIDSAIPQSMVGDVDNTAYYVYDYQTDKMGELVDLREKLKFSNVKVDVTIVQDDELKYGDDLPSELQNATFHQALNYVFKNDDVEKFAIRPKK
jgi:hypothetical protein